VIDTGPYARIRHPGYLGLCLWAMASPLLLRSPAAFVVAGLTVGWVALRTAREDRLLRRELPGYASYAARVRWRLLPGLW
jgi:protein-S-isoprenylcysteine O-methyltransferase Ste14